MYVNFTITLEDTESWSQAHDFNLEENVGVQNFSSDSELSAALGALENKYPGMAEFQAGDSEVNMRIHSLAVNMEVSVGREYLLYVN